MTHLKTEPNARRCIVRFVIFLGFASDFSVTATLITAGHIAVRNELLIFCTFTSLVIALVVRMTCALIVIRAPRFPRLLLLLIAVFIRMSKPYIMGSELELRLCQNLTNLAKFQLREKVLTCPRTGDGCWNFGFFRGFWRYGSRMSLGALNYSWSPSFANHSSSWYIRFPPKFQFKWYQK